MLFVNIKKGKFLDLNEKPMLVLKNNTSLKITNSRLSEVRNILASVQI